MGVQAYHRLALVCRFFRFICQHRIFDMLPPYSQKSDQHERRLLRSHDPGAVACAELVMSCTLSVLSLYAAVVHGQLRGPLSVDHLTRDSHFAEGRLTAVATFTSLRSLGLSNIPIRILLVKVIATFPTIQIDYDQAQIRWIPARGTPQSVRTRLGVYRSISLE